MAVGRAQSLSLADRNAGRDHLSGSNEGSVVHDRPVVVFPERDRVPQQTVGCVIRRDERIDGNERVPVGALMLVTQADRVADLSAKLRAAVTGSYPESGEIPELRQGVWAPNLTDP